MRVVITGASGFIGGALLNTLISEGYDCIGVSRRKVHGLQQVGSYSDSPVGDILIHLAEANDRAQVNRLGRAYEQDAANTLRSLLGKGYCKIIYASSAVLYGDGTCRPHAETDSVSADDTYTRVKLASEQALLNGASGSIARVANIYGPGMSSGNVLSDILRQLNNERPVLLWDTAPIRDFLWAGDAVDAFKRMVTESANGIFNVGSGVGTSISNLAEMTLDAAGQANRLIVSQKQSSKPSCIILDVTNTIKRLGWQPAMPLDEGLRQLVIGQTSGVHTND